jgi:hypothetical protein
MRKKNGIKNLVIIEAALGQFLKLETSKAEPK